MRKVASICFPKIAVAVWNVCKLKVQVVCSNFAIWQSLLFAMLHASCCSVLAELYVFCIMQVQFAYLVRLQWCMRDCVHFCISLHALSAVRAKLANTIASFALPTCKHASNIAV